MGRETTAEKREIELLDSVYRRAVSRFIQRLSSVDETRWSKARRKEKESGRDILAHLVLGQDTGLQLIRASLDGRPGQADPGSAPSIIDETSLAGLSGIELMRTLGRVTEEQLAVLLALPDDGLLEQPAVVPEWRRIGTLRHLYDHLYVHVILHYQQIRSMVGNPRLSHWFEDWMPESTNDFYSRAIGLAPLIYNPEALELDAAYICVDLRLPGGGRWGISLDGANAALQPGCEGEPTTTIHGRPAQFFDYWIGGGGKIKTRGDSGPADKFAALFPLS